MHNITKKAPPNPCDLCTSSQKCIQDKCIPIGECYPECEEGFECDNGVCKESKVTCKKGWYYSKSKNKCFKNYCYGVKCGQGKKCVGGKCKTIVKPPSSCSPKCQSNEYCNSNLKCIKKLPSNVVGKILSFWKDPKGTGTYLLINKGSKHGIKAGNKGKLNTGATITVKETYPYRCKAHTGKPTSQFTTNMKVTFKK